MQQLLRSPALSCVPANETRISVFVSRLESRSQVLPRLLCTRKLFVCVCSDNGSKRLLRHPIRCTEIPASEQEFIPSKSAKVLAFIGRALLFAGLTFLTMPAMGKPAANASSTQQEAVTTATQSLREDKLGEEHASKVEEEERSLCTAFWKGITIPERSLLESLKLHLDKKPDDCKALGLLLRLVMEHEDMLRALTVVEKLVELQPESLRWKFLKARVHETLGEMSMARAGYEELVNLHPHSARFLQGLVLLLNRAGQQDEALALIQDALNRAMAESKIAEAGNFRVLLGQLYTQQGRFDAALKEFENMLAQDANDFRAYLCQGLVYTLTGEGAKAEQSFGMYRQLCPKDFLDRRYLDDLMLKAKIGNVWEKILKPTLERPYKNQERKRMKQPTLTREKPTPEPTTVQS